MDLVMELCRDLVKDLFRDIVKNLVKDLGGARQTEANPREKGPRRGGAGAGRARGRGGAARRGAGAPLEPRRVRVRVPRGRLGPGGEPQRTARAETEKCGTQFDFCSSKTDDPGPPPPVRTMPGGAENGGAENEAPRPRGRPWSPPGKALAGVGTALKGFGGGGGGGGRKPDAPRRALGDATNRSTNAGQPAGRLPTGLPTEQLANVIVTK